MPADDRSPKPASQLMLLGTAADLLGFSAFVGPLLHPCLTMGCLGFLRKRCERVLVRCKWLVEFCVMPFKPAMHESDVRAQMGRELKRNSQKTVFDARQRLTSSSGTRASFDFELLDDYANTRIAGVFAIAGLVLILALFSSLWVHAAGGRSMGDPGDLCQCRGVPGVPPVQARGPWQVQRGTMDDEFCCRRDGERHRLGDALAVQPRCGGYNQPACRNVRHGAGWGGGQRGVDTDTSRRDADEHAAFGGDRDDQPAAVRWVR